MDNLAPVLGGSAEAPAALRERVERGELGAKTGRGIYEYPGSRAADRIRQRDRLLVRLARLKGGLPH